MRHWTRWVRYRPTARARADSADRRPDSSGEPLDHALEQTPLRRPTDRRLDPPFRPDNHAWTISCVNRWIAAGRFDPRLGRDAARRLDPRSWRIEWAGRIIRDGERHRGHRDDHY